MKTLEQYIKTDESSLTALSEKLTIDSSWSQHIPTPDEIKKSIKPYIEFRPKFFTDPGTGGLAIEGDLYIKNYPGEILQLNITKLYGSLNIHHCPNLKTLEGIFDDEAVMYQGDSDKSVSVWECPMLTNFTLPESLEIKGLYIDKCPGLKTLDWFKPFYNTVENVRFGNNGKKFKFSDIMQLFTNL